jgi:hypothetical protein
MICSFRYEKKTVAFFYKFCFLCTKFTPSTLYTPYQKWQRSFVIDNTWVPIPYTSSWHYYEVKDKNRFDNRTWAWEFDINKKRSNYIVFVGIIKKMQKEATSLRRALVSQCTSANQSSISNDTTNVFDFICKAYVLGKDSWKNFGAEAALYKNSSFCLLPMGDIPSRKAVFDMLLAGCVIY